MNIGDTEGENSDDSDHTSEGEKKLSDWFDRFKDDKGEWVKDSNLLVGLMSLFGYWNKDETEENEKKAIEEEKDNIYFFPKGSFLDKLPDLIETAKEFLMSRDSTLIAPGGPYRAKKPNFLFYEEFHAYLEGQKFIENMVEVLVKMFSMHPELPADPLEFIRENYGISKKSEDRLIEQWKSVTDELFELYEEEKTLEEKISRHRDRLTLMENTSEEALILEELEREQSRHKVSIDLENRLKAGTLFMWEPDENTSGSSETSIIDHPEPAKEEVESSTTSCSPVLLESESSSSLDMGSHAS